MQGTYNALKTRAQNSVVHNHKNGAPYLSAHKLYVQNHQNLAQNSVVHNLKTGTPNFGAQKFFA
jgi:hypothetical protein